MIRIDPTARIGRINPNLYGMFIEHLGRCIYGGIYDEGSRLSDSEGFRIDVLKACQRLAPPLLRWPGGNFVSGYHWLDGIGAKDKRPRQFDRAWFAEESNRFGTDEFIAFCRRLGSEPYICANAGTGTLDEAAAWVEYCNGWGDTHYANLRRQGGNRVPYNVRYWGLGNEMYGSWQIGHLDAEDYAKKALEMAKLMRWTDPRIALVACGLGQPEWDEPVLERLRSTPGGLDYLSVHCYVGDNDYYKNVSSVTYMEDILERTKASLCRVFGVNDAAQAPVKIAVDEWNVWFSNRSNEPYDNENKLREIYDLSDALCVGTFLHLFQRECRVVTMANLAQMVNVIAPILTSPDGLILQAIYHPLVLLRHHSGDYAVEASADAGELTVAQTGTRPVPILDLSASVSEDGARLYLSVVNRHESEAIESPLVVSGATVEWQRGWQVNAAGVHERNSFEQPNLVRTRELHPDPTARAYTFPAHSHTVLEASLH